MADGGMVPLRVVRDGSEMQLDVPVRLPRQLLLAPLRGEYPPYFVYGPLVFIPATMDYLTGLEAYLGSSNARRRAAGIAALAMLARRRSPMITRRFDYPEFEGEQLVMVTNWLQHRIDIGYATPVTQIVQSVNGQPIRNLAHLVETLRDLDAEYVRFEFADRAVETLIFQRAQLLGATDDILVNHGIPRQGSPELLRLWNNGGQVSRP